MCEVRLRLVSAFTFILAGAVAATASLQGLPPPPSSESSSDKPGIAASGPSAFDVASVHEHGGADHMMRWMNKADGISTVNIPLQSLIASAYNIKMDLVSGGPSWVNTKGFDIDAKVLPGEGTGHPELTEAQQRALLRALLIDRFHLKAHIESKILPIYDLTVAKGVPKMHVAPPQPRSEEDKPGYAKLGDLKERGSMMFGPGHIQAHAYKMSSLADNLGFIVERTVHDKTGLTGEYDIDLSWTPEDQLQEASDKAATGTDLKPSIYAAVQEQLGLKLVPSKGPVDTLVIDHLELPTPN